MGSLDKPQQPEREYTQEYRYKFVNIENLEENERRAIMAASERYAESENADFRAGAAALADDNTVFSANNNVTGQLGHAEQQALAGLYEQLLTAGKPVKLKAVALVGSRPYESPVRGHSRFGSESPEAIDWEKICGHCLKFINDYSSGNTEDVTILILATNGQIMRTSLRALYPQPHRVTRVPLAPIRHPATKKDFVAGEIAKLPEDVQEEMRRLKPFDFDNPRKEPEAHPEPHGDYSAPK